jgi:hypothetical protein
MVKGLNKDQKVLIKKPGQKTTKEFLNMGNVTNLRENKTLFVPCDCRSEILMIEYDHSLRMADFAIYETFAAYQNKMSLWQRIRYCWQVLWKHKPYADYMVLSNKQLKELKSFLCSLDL